LLWCYWEVRIVPLFLITDAYNLLNRNGGHINPSLYHEYPSLVKRFGREMAQKIIRFRISHLKELLVVAQEEGILMESQCREAEYLSVYYDERKWALARKKFTIWKREMPEESKGFRAMEGKEAVEVCIPVRTCS
jgi:hypothetical protein